MNAPAVNFYDGHPGDASLLDEVLRGLAAKPKVIPPKFFYDKRGSELFDAICELPEYYPTRTEVAILRDYAGSIARRAGQQCLLVELGSGASKKVRLLLEALRPSAYMGIDISKDFLLESTRKLAADYPWLEVHAACADYSQSLELPHCPSNLPKLAFFPGSSIGNFDPQEALLFLERLKLLLDPDGALLIGVDMKKDPQILEAAYNDAQGVTAAFNLNVLKRIQRELDTDLDPAAFRHDAFYNDDAGRVEMHLVSRREQQVRVDGKRFSFDQGESIHTESSYKYTVAEFHELARGAGYEAEEVWTDPRQFFSVHYLRLAG